MAATSRIALILGAGPNVGQNVAQALKAKGYKVALTSRKAPAEGDTADQISISSDLSDPTSVANVFSKVKAWLGPPAVVIYNAGALTPNDAKDPLSLPLDKFIRDFNINTTSAFAAAQQAALSFEQLPASSSRTFIYTGNILNTTTMAGFLDLGVGKTATAHIIESAAAAYKDRGFKFYYVDERTPNGSAVFNDIDGQAHADHFVKLTEDQSQGPWQQTFVKGVGYKHFPIA